MAPKATLRQIQAVIAVCEDGSFTRAAERKNAAIGHIAARLRDGAAPGRANCLSAPRTGVAPTPAGLRCLQRYSMLSAVWIALGADRRGWRVP